MAYECPLCKNRGKTWNGSDPRCAFSDKGDFISENWNCATMNKLRDLCCKYGTVMRDDNSCGTIGYLPMDNDYAPDNFETFGGYIVLIWYKSHGRTDNAVFISDDECVPLTLRHAETAIKTYEGWQRRRGVPHAGCEY